MKLNAFENEIFNHYREQQAKIKKAIKLGKIETIKYYRDNPDSFSVVIGTDMLNDYFNDIETLLQQ